MTLYSMPATTVGDVSERLKVSVPTANELVKDFVKLGILKQSNIGKRNRVFFFREYLALFAKKKTLSM